MSRSGHLTNPTALLLIIPLEIRATSSIKVLMSPWMEKWQPSFHVWLLVVALPHFFTCICDFSPQHQSGQHPGTSKKPLAQGLNAPRATDWWKSEETGLWQ
jgi:hypothetical protein